MKISINSLQRYDILGVDDPEKRGVKGYKCKWIGWILEHIFCKAVAIKTDQGTFYFNRKSYSHWKKRTHVVKLPVAPAPPPVGFKYFANNCYLNAALQILFHIPEVRDMILKKENHPIVNQLKVLLNRKSVSETEISLRYLQEKVFHNQEQQDAGEAISFLAAILNWIPMKMVSYFRLENINHPAHEEKTNTLPLAITESKDPIDPQDLICNFFREVPLEGKVTIPINGIPVESEQWRKQFQISSFPSHILLQLNRGSDDGRTKIMSPVVLKQNLWLPSKDGKVDYEVVGWGNHHGKEPGEGHHTADLKVGDSWFRCDDAYVTAKNLPAVSKDAHVILLKKVQPKTK